MQSMLAFTPGPIEMCVVLSVGIVVVVKFAKRQLDL